MNVFLAFLLFTAGYFALIVRRRQNNERGAPTSNLVRGLIVVAGIGYFGFGMWLVSELTFVLP